MLNAVYIEIKHAVSASTSSQWFEEDRQENRVEMQDYDDLHRAGVHTKVTMRPFVIWGEGSLRKLKMTVIGR